MGSSFTGYYCLMRLLRAKEGFYKWKGVSIITLSLQRAVCRGVHHENTCMSGRKAKREKKNLPLTVNCKVKVCFCGFVVVFFISS